MHPILLHYGHLYLPTFGALAAAGLMFALSLSERTARLSHVDPEFVWNAGIFAVVAAFVLSRMLLIVANFASFRMAPVLLLAVPSLTPAGLLLTSAAVAAWLWFRRLPAPRVLDAWAPAATLLWAFLALGHFAEGSDPGLPTTLPWGMRFPGETLRLQPVALLAAVLAAVLTAWLYRMLERPHTTGAVAAEALFLTGLAQYLLSFLRQPGEPSLGGLDALQLVALAMLLAGAGILIYLHERRSEPSTPFREAVADAV